MKPYFLIALLPLIGVHAASPATDAIHRAARFYHTELAAHGGYVYYYAPDLSWRHGEGPASPTQIWVQPPGTPTVGKAFLKAYQTTKAPFLLDAATDAAEALIYGQLESGGWTNSIDFDPKGKTADYRNGKGRGKNNSSLDDGQTQSAIRFLVQADAAHSFRHETIHEAATIALDALLAAQFPNGAFPQVWTGPVPEHPVLKASFPNYDWRTEGRIKDYWNHYTLNDGLVGEVAATLITAARTYNDKRYADALRKLGDFLTLAQMPDPQPAWAQQYNADMHPIWARRFEPPAIAGRESEDAVATLLLIAHTTRDPKNLQPVPQALAYLKKSLLPDGRLARYYELETNKPLYMSRRGKDYTLTHDDSALPSHYGWKNEHRLAELESRYRQLAADITTPPTSPEEPDIQKIIGSLDAKGRWITTFAGEPLPGQPKFKPGDRYISSAVFAENITALCEHLE